MSEGPRIRTPMEAQMTTFETFSNGSRPSRGSAFRAIAHGVAARIATRVRIWKNRRSVARLLTWDDRMLGDIGLTPPFGVMDWAGWFEAYLGGAWHTFDPRNNTPRIGRVLMARGRDAVDVAISTTFGPNILSSFKVYADQVVGAPVIG